VTKKSNKKNSFSSFINTKNKMQTKKNLRQKFQAKVEKKVSSTSLINVTNFDEYFLKIHSKISFCNI